MRDGWVAIAVLIALLAVVIALKSCIVEEANRKQYNIQECVAREIPYEKCDIYK